MLLIRASNDLWIDCRCGSRVSFEAIRCHAEYFRHLCLLRDASYFIAPNVIIYILLVDPNGSSASSLFVELNNL